MVGCGSLSDCGEECEIQLSASHHPPALTLCGSDHRLAPSHYDKLHTVSLSQQPQHLPKKKEKSRILLIKADIPLRMFGSHSLPLIKLLLSLFT